MNIQIPSHQFLVILQVLCFIPKSYNFPVCATLKNNEGESFVIPELYKIPDFNFDYFPNKKPLSFFGQNISLEISTGCQFYQYDQTYFKVNKTVGNKLTGNAKSGSCYCRDVRLNFEFTSFAWAGTQYFAFICSL